MLKNTALAALCALLFLPAAHAADLHACKLSADRRSVTVLVSNPYTQETHCTVNCHITFPVFIKLADAGNFECVKPLAEQNTDKDDDDDDKLGEQIRKQSEEMLRMLKRK